AVYTVCNEWRNAAVALLQEIKPAVVFMGSASSYAFDERQWRDGTKRILTRRAPVSDRIYIIRGSHRLPFDGPACLAKKNWQPTWISELTKCSADAVDLLDGQSLAGIKAAVAEFSNIAILDLNRVICPGDHCYSQIRDQIVFRDTQHLTNSFV